MRQYSAIIAFTTNEGNELKFESQRYTLFPPRVGEDVEVYYSLKPLHAVENKFMSLWGIPLLLLILSGVLLSFSFFYDVIIKK